MKRSFSDITGEPVDQILISPEIEYLHPCFELETAKVVARVSFSFQDHPTRIGERPDLNREDVVTLLRGLFETFRDTRPGA